nr:DUF3073 domain-containing protein [Actinomycetales bacterium]
MGRGRQRAKQAKVARQLKYFSPQTDYHALQRELAGTPADDDRYTDPYADKYADEYGDDDEDDDDAEGDAEDEFDAPAVR